jgi:DNA-binding transcriptional LysR family regulator
MLDAYRHFVWVVEMGTFTAAAARAHLSQPALSASIRRLEEHVGAQLLRRHARGAVPTAAGEALLPRVRAALAALDEGQRAVDEVQGLARGDVRLGGGATACTYWLPPLLARFRREHPGVTVRLREVFSSRVAEEVAAGRLDLGVGSPASQVHSEAFRDDELVLVATPEVAATLKRQGDRLAPGTPLVSFPAGSSLRSWQDRALPDGEVVMEVRSFAAVKGLVRAGIGVALLSRSSVVNDVAEGRLVEVHDARRPGRRPVALLHHGVKRLSPAGLALRALLLDDVAHAH